MRGAYLSLGSEVKVESHDADCCYGAVDRLADAAGHHPVRLSYFAARFRSALCLRLLPDTHVAGEWMGPRCLRARIRAAEPAVGHRAAIRARRRGPLRHGA